ncbi:MAG: twin-arginine translocase TatA/TatE family subunit [Thermodesulfobacteriota bacterium]
MFGYNLGTIIIILVIVLLLFGPRRLPELGDSIGKAIRSFKKAHDEGPEAVPREEAKTSDTATAGSQTKACPKCHKELTQDYAFCPHCGQNLKA